MGIKDTLNETKTIATAIAAVIGLSGTIIGGIIYVDDRYAKAEELVEVKKDVSLIELKDQLRIAQEEYYFLKKQSRKYPDDEDIAEELVEIKVVIKDLKESIKELTKKKNP